MENYTELRQALTALNNVCDGASSQDQQGFNRFDSPFARDLAAKPSWTYNMANAVHKMLSKYKNQLSGMEILYDKIPVPSPTDQQIVRPSYKTAAVKNDMIYLNFGGSTEEFKKILEEIRRLPGRVWNKDEKQWSLPANKYSYDKLGELGFEIKGGKIEEVKPADINVSLQTGLKLYPFQEEGVQLLEKFNGRALLADDMGLGKSAQSIVYMKLHPELRPALIVVPATLKLNWHREIKKWMPEEGDNVQIIQGRQSVFYDDKKITIINYDILKDYLELLMEMNFKIMIIDESSAIKNPKAMRTKAVKKISRKMEKIICLSGTPIMNRPIEFFTTLNMLDPKLFPNWYHFGMEYCGSMEDGFKGHSNTDKLHKILVNSFMIRRLKKDVLKDLPLKQRSVIPMEINNRKEYEKAEADIINYLHETEGQESAIRATMAEVLVKFEKLKQLTVAGKREQIFSWIDTFLESGEKLILFCVHHSAIDMIMAKYPDISVKLDGRDNMNQKQKSVDEFQNNPDVKLFVGNIKAAGMGITLTAASNVAFIELDWIPAAHDQAEDRSLRIGQKAASVNIYYLLGENTIDEDMAEIIDKKRQVITAIMDGEAPEDENMLTILMNRYRKK
jgi:SNF2 family DNA or RNA helicase